jgi:hypothetical protein
MRRTRTPSLYETAVIFPATGRSVVPIAPGSKAPSLIDPRTGRSILIPRQRYQNTRATPEEVRR